MTTDHDLKSNMSLLSEEVTKLEETVKVMAMRQDQLKALCDALDERCELILGVMHRKGLL